MQRSWSSSRVTEELLVNSSHNLRPNNEDRDQVHQLPTYNPLSDVARKERSRLRFAQNAIHVIPLVLVLCAIVLWFFSNHGIFHDSMKFEANDSIEFWS